MQLNKCLKNEIQHLELFRGSYKSSNQYNLLWIYHWIDIILLSISQANPYRAMLYQSFRRDYIHHVMLKYFLDCIKTK